MATAPSATPTFTEWSSGIAATETAAAAEHAKLVASLEAQRRDADAKLEKATVELALRRKSESRARHRKVSQKIGTDLVAPFEAVQRGGREQAAALVSAFKRAHQMRLEYLGEPLQPREVLGALVAITIKSDPAAVNAFGQAGRPFANGGPPFGVHLDSAGRLIDLALRGGSSGEILRAVEAVEIDVARGARQSRGVTRPEESEAARRIVEAWRFDQHDVVSELIAALQREEQERNTACWQTEQQLANRARAGEQIERRDSVWHASVRAIRSMVGGVSL